MQNEPDYVLRAKAYQRAYYLAHREAKIAYARADWNAKKDAKNAARRKAREDLRYTPRGIPNSNDKAAYNRRYHTDVMAERFFRERIRTLQTICQAARPICRACGEQDILVLAINHRNGHGRRDVSALKTYRLFLASIRNGERSTDDLEVLCHNCNIRYEYERGKRHLPTNWPDPVEEEVAAWKG